MDALYGRFRDLSEAEESLQGKRPCNRKHNFRLFSQPHFL